MPTITLKSSDGEEFKVEKTVALELQAIKQMIADEGTHNSVTVPNVSGKILRKVIKFCEKHLDADNGNITRDELKAVAFDTEFVNVGRNTLVAICIAARDLDIKTLFEFTIQTFVDIVNRMETPEEIREYLGIENDFTPEEIEEILKNPPLAFY